MATSTIRSVLIFSMFIPAAAVAQLQQAPSRPQVLTRELVQAKIDSLPISGEPSVGGVVLFGTGNHSIKIDKPILIPSGVDIDFGNALITYTGDPRRAAIEFDSSKYGHGFVVNAGIRNARIISTGACIGVSSNVMELTNPIVSNILISGGPGRYAIDLPRRCYYADISNITMYNSGGACLRIVGNLNNLSKIWCRGQPRDNFKLPDEGALILLDHDGTTGCGSIRSVECSVTRAGTATTGIRVRGQYTIESLWSELPNQSPAVHAEGKLAAVRVTDPILLDDRIKATDGGRVLIDYIRPKIADEWGRAKDQCDADPASKIESREWP